MEDVRKYTSLQSCYGWEVATRHVVRLFTVGGWKLGQDLYHRSISLPFFLFESFSFSIHIFDLDSACTLEGAVTADTMADIEKHINNEQESPQPASSIASADYTHINEKKLLRKLDWRLLPGVSLLYLVSFLDRSNVANARLEGLTTDLGMTGNEYLTGLTVFFIGYISLEVVWNLILKRIGPRIWLPAVTIVWGIVTTLQGVLVNKVGFFVIRTALGISEGALFPGVVFYLSMWYKREERTYRVALFFSAASLAGAFGGILAYVSFPHFES